MTAQLCAVTALATGNRVLAGPSGIGSAARILSASRRSRPESRATTLAHLDQGVQRVASWVPEMYA
ncbi:MAG: hypothetical protein ACUVQC_02680 [Thermaceae bacterium]